MNWAGILSQLNFHFKGLNFAEMNMQMMYIKHTYWTWFPTCQPLFDERIVMDQSSDAGSGHSWLLRFCFQLICARESDNSFKVKYAGHWCWVVGRGGELHHSLAVTTTTKQQQRRRRRAAALLHIHVCVCLPRQIAFVHVIDLRYYILQTVSVHSVGGGEGVFEGRVRPPRALRCLY